MRLMETASWTRDTRSASFYDQVHTTGMDIAQGFDSCAAVILGKDMSRGPAPFPAFVVCFGSEPGMYRPFFLCW